MQASESTTSNARPLLAICLLFSVPFIVGAALAPHAFNGLRALGDVTDAVPKLTEAPFERVASRCVMIVALFMLYPVLKLTGLLPRIKQSLRGSRDRYRELGTSILVGCVSIIALYGIGYHLDAYILSPAFKGAGPFALKFAEYLVGAIFIGLFEEVFFRGFIFGGLRSRLGFAVALVLSAVMFSGIHFFRPLYPTVIEQASWNTGFAIMPYMFEKFVPERDTVFAITLFIIGLTLATYYEKRGSLYFIAGLHGGWVLAMRTGGYVFDRNNHVLPAWFGQGDLISKGYIALIVVSLFFVAALAERRRKSDA